MSHYPNTNERGIRHPGATPGSGTFGESPASGPAPTTAGHHKHDLLNKLDPRVDSTHDRAPAQAMMQGGNSNNIPAGTYGPHSSRVANALDPRVDSDLDGRGRMQGGGGGGGGMVGGMTGAGAGAVAYGSGAPEGTYGPHNSRIANALDPRVDSDRDGRGAHGTSGAYQTQAGSGYPHDGTTGAGYGQPVGGGLGHGRHQQQYPQHQQQAGYGGTGAMSGAASGPGPAPNTAGPHKSDLMNKLDPRVDSKTGVMKDSGYSERRGI